MSIKTHEFKFESTTPLPEKDADFWWHDNLNIDSVKVEVKGDTARIKFVVEEPFYLPSNEEDEDYVPDNWEPSKVTFLQAEPITLDEAENVETALVYMMKTDYIDAFDVKEGRGEYNLDFYF
jgi:hypothetical protein